MIYRYRQQMCIWNILIWFSFQREWLMRYVIMIQVVSIVTLILLGASAMFAWLQNRTLQESLDLDNTSLLSD